MLSFPQIDPYVFQLNLGFMVLRPTWYGLMYVVAFFSGLYLMKIRAKRFGWQLEEVDRFLNYLMLGVVLGGRIGYCLFPYGWAAWSRDWTFIFRIWEGGMSFHGGLIGVLCACWLFGRRTQRPFLVVGDFVAMVAPLGIFFGRIGNFINGELWGSPSSVPWAMVFPDADAQPRHPTQLYEALLEGLILFVVIWLYTRQPRVVGRASGLFLLGYGIARCTVELWRVPDSHLGYYLGFLTMGQILSLPMIVFGLYLLRRKP